MPEDAVMVYGSEASNSGGKSRSNSAQKENQQTPYVIEYSAFEYDQSNLRETTKSGGNEQEKMQGEYAQASLSTFENSNTLSNSRAESDNQFSSLIDPYLLS